MNVRRHLSDFFTAWMMHDAAKMARFYANDAVMEDPTLDQPRRGRDAIEHYYRDMFAALEDPYHELVDYSSREDRVWFEWTFGSGGRAQTLVEQRGVSIQTMRDELIIHDAAFWTPR